MKKYFKTKAATLKTNDGTSARKIRVICQSINNFPNQPTIYSNNKGEVNNEYFNKQQPSASMKIRVKDKISLSKPLS